MPRYPTIDRRGVVHPRQLGIGTADTNAFLRGDGTWASVSSAGGVPGPQGPAGADGADGADGAQGPAGPPGASVWGTITGTLSDQTDLQSALDGKSSTAHQHFLLYASLSHAHFGDYASLSHAHAQSDVTNLVTDLAGKSSTSHQHFSLYASLTHAHFGDYASLTHTHFGTYASLSHVHAASDITSGTMATNILGSGTANSSTYLRGDSTWGTPGGGSNPFTMAFSTINTGTNSNTVFATVNYVKLPVTSGKRYIVEGFLIYRTQAITTGLNLAWNIPSGCTIVGQSVITNALLTASVLSNNAVASSSGASTAPVWLNADNPAYVWLLASLSTTSGNIVPMFRSEINTSFATLQASSMWRMMEIV